MSKDRPVSVTIISAIYIAAGALGLVYHLNEFKVTHPFSYAIVWISLIRALAIVCGAYMLRGDNWARWVALIWMVFHVAISVVNGWQMVTIHAALLTVFAFFLLRGPAAEYFLTPRTS